MNNWEIDKMMFLSYQPFEQGNAVEDRLSRAMEIGSSAASGKCSKTLAIFQSYSNKKNPVQMTSINCWTLDVAINSIQYHFKK